MKLNNPSSEILGNLGGGAAQRWNPQSHDYYERQWRSQRGAWGNPGAENKLQGDVEVIIHEFQARGTRAGLEEAQRRGLLEAARLYVSIRAYTEEELAALLARIRARLATRPLLQEKLREAFVLARLDEVRQHQANGHTPPQAVADRPEIPRKTVPRWVPIAALVMSAVAFVRSMK